MKFSHASISVSDGGCSHFGFEVEDIDEVHGCLRISGVRIHSPDVTFMGGSLRAFFARDPEYHVYEGPEPGKADV